MARPEMRADLRLLEGYHSPQVDVAVRLNTNESPHPPPPAFMDAFVAELAQCRPHRYPDRSATRLRADLGRFLSQDPSRVFCANGSNEVLQTILLAYGGPGRTAMVFPPSYVLHEHIARITGTAVTAVDRSDGYHLDTGAVAARVTETAPDVVFLTTPNNPTGLVEPTETIEALLAAAPGLVVVDEAYGEFAPDSALRLVSDTRNLVVVRTYSKIWSMAAFRLGFCVGPSWLAADLAKVVLPYHLSVPTQVAGTVALRFADEMRARVAAIVAERERLSGALSQLDVDVWPSGANFILFRPRRVRGVWDGLLERDVLVRDFSHLRGLEGCLRVTVGTAAENDVFLTALKEVLA